MKKILLGIFLFIIVALSIFVICFSRNKQLTFNQENINNTQQTDNEFLAQNEDEIVMQDMNNTNLKPVMELADFCLGENLSKDEYIDYFKNQGEFAGYAIESFFKNDDFINLEEQMNSTVREGILYGGIKKLCLINNETIAFVLYGNFENNNNNTIGVYNYTADKLTFDQKYSKSMGDLGVCNITGSIDDDIIYNCGGGDGPYGFNKIFILDKETGLSKVIKDCGIFEGEESCKINLLNVK